MVPGSDELALDLNSEARALASEQPPRSLRDDALLRQDAVRGRIAPIELQERLVRAGPAGEAHFLTRIQQAARGTGLAPPFTVARDIRSWL